MTLLQVRGRKQAAVTVLLSSIERFIVAEDDDKVQRQLDMLHQAFDLYEAAHLEVLTSLDGDPQEHCKESLKFVDIERSYTLGVKNAKSYLKRANISVHDPTTTMCQLMNVPKVELRAFSGDSSDYLSFMSIFNETVDNAPLSGQAKLTRLLGYTRDKARLAIDHCSLIGGDEGYQEAKKILQERFGDQYVIATNLIRSLQTGKSVHSAEDLRLLSDQLHNAALVLKGKNTYSELDSQHNLKKICSRLSSHLNNKWRERVFAIKRKHMRYASFGEFVAFMKEKSDEANDPLYGQDSSSKQQASSNRPVTSSMNCVSTLKSPLKCVLCNESHLLFKCTKFKNMDYDDRQSVVSRNKLCVNCLRPSHTVPQCKYKRFCNVSDCTTKHNGLLHKFTSVASNSATNKSVNAVMPIVHVMINNTLKVRCLLDTGSTSSFVTKNLVSKLDLPRSPVKLSIMTLNSSVAEESHIVNFDIESMDHNYCVNMTNIFVVDDIPGKAYNLDLTQYPHLYNIDVIDNFDGRIDLLIGQDYADCFQPLELLKGNKNEPYAVRTPLGYVVHGPNSQHVASNCVVSNLVSASTLQRDVNRLWELDQFDIAPDAKCIMSDDDDYVLSMWEDRSRFNDGHWHVPIPWNKSGATLPNNYDYAKARLMSLRVTLTRKGILDKYDVEISKLLSNGYAEEVTEDVSSSNIWYLPHHCVPKKDGKIRLVFDCASKFNGISLNSIVYQGPDYINRLQYVLLRFRQHQYAITADIESMYSQVKVTTSDRDALRFLWIINGVVKRFRMTSHLFGGIWSSSCACYALRKSADMCPIDSDVRSSIQSSFYVDDYLQSVDSLDIGVRLVTSVKEMLQANRFHLTKFCSNNPDLLCEIPPVDCMFNSADSSIQLSESKVLGVRWNLQTDYFSFDVNIPVSSVISRRTILSLLASIFDPLGLISPIIVEGKVIFQKTTMLKLSWDDAIPAELVQQWRSWLEKLQLLAHIRVPRCIKLLMYNDSLLELHSFSDASEYSYGCCIYQRCISKSGVSSSLVYAKHRLAPVKHTTIPRLELQAATLSARLTSTILKELDLNVTNTYFWTDSMIVLCYIKNSSRRFRPFVANRLGVIRKITAVKDWFHVDGKDNPADIVSRGTSPDRLHKSIWLQGPPFLSQYKSEWKTNCPNVDELDVDDRELKKSVALVCTQGSIHPIDLLCSHFSSWYKLKKALSWILRVRNALLHRTSCKGLISVDELKESERIILRHVQLSCFPSEVTSLFASKSVAKSSVLHKLSPMLNEERLLVVQGRLTHSPVGVDHRFPIVVPHKHPISSLIVSDIHGSAHLGQEWVVSIVRNRFWITNMRRVVKRVARDCIVCKKRFAAPGCQRMADLPSSRVTPYNPPFFAVGLDCFGPFLVTHGRSQAKRYGCVFSCFATRAFHVEKLHSLDTDSMINALRRFIARRGNPDHIFCDNGTNLTSCCKELKRSLKALSQSDLHSFCLSHEIKWNFAPPQSSHMGGVYERMIRTFRRVFTGILNPRTRLTDEILSTVFCEVESIINGRPITKTTTDVDDLSVLTPNHLLLLRGVVNVSPGVFKLGDVFRKRWRYVQSLANLFWKRWLSCYLPDLQRRVKWQDKNRNLRVGDLVLICDITAPRGSWPLGVVVEVHVGRDELVRSARVRTSTSQLVRPVTKLVLLEGYDVP